MSTQEEQEEGNGEGCLSVGGQGGRKYGITEESNTCMHVRM